MCANRQLKKDHDKVGSIFFDQYVHIPQIAQEVHIQHCVTHFLQFTISHVMISGTTTLPTPTVCLCNNTRGQCVSYTAMCDGNYDCPGGWDEFYCPSKFLSRLFNLSHSQSTISLSYRIGVKLSNV